MLKYIWTAWEESLMKTRLQKIVIASLMAALVCVATMIIKIPSPMKGYVNLGDCMVLLSGWIISPIYGFAAAGLGSALADMLSGYIVYAPATFAIKGLMALTAYYGFKIIHKKMAKLPARIISGVSAEIIMVAGYFLFEGILYGFVPSMVNIPANAIQGMVGLLLGIVIVKKLENSKLSF